MRKVIYIFILASLICTCLHAQTPANGLFTVNAYGKTVRFANAVSGGLHQFSELASLQGGEWRLLTSAEWNYLLLDQDWDDGTSTGRHNAKFLNALGTVNGRKGLIILSDYFVVPVGLEFHGNLFYYDANVYDADQWAMMSAAGAVFLPCEGYGWDDSGGHHTENEDDFGTYWTTTEDHDYVDHAFRIAFEQNTAHNKQSAPQGRYCSVILVKEVDVTVLDEDDESPALATKLPVANTKDFAVMHRSLGKDGTLYTLCLPFDVPDIDVSPLAGAEMFTFGGGTVSGSTGSEELHLNLKRLTGKRLYQGVPYILRWNNTGETMTMLYFYGVQNWDNNTDAAADPGNAIVKYHGMYPKAHIPGYLTGEEAHYNFFMGANNTLYWPDDAAYPDSKMKGFRAYFYIIPSSGPSALPMRRGMQPVWHIHENTGVVTGVDNIEGQNSISEIKKILRDGQVILVIDGKTYTIGGQIL